MFLQDRVCDHRQPWVIRFDQLQKAAPGHNAIHLGKKPFAATSLKFAGVLQVGKAPLTHAKLGSGDEGISQNIWGSVLGLSRVLTQHLCGHIFGTLREQNTAKVRFKTHIIARTQAFEIKGFFIHIPYKSTR